MAEQRSRSLVGRAARTVAKTASGIGAALLVLTVGPVATAYASTSTFVPCSGSGAGSAGLIAAINAANSSGGGTINLARGCTYLLTSADNTSSNPIIGSNGLPVITSKITINGAREENDDSAAKEGEAAATTIAGNSTDFRIFDVAGPGGDLTLQGLTITGGFGSAGGGILNAEGAVTLNHSRVTGNTAGFGGGGIGSGVVDTNQLGPVGTLTLNFSQVNGNTALGGGGGGILNHAGTLTLNFSQVNANTSKGGGGGIASGPGNGGGPPAIAGSSTLVIRFSEVNGNTATGGAMSGGGGIANGGMATIIGSDVDNNAAPGGVGGAIFNHGTMTINGSDVKGNKAPKAGLNDGGGGGIANVNFGLVIGPGAVTGVLTLNHSEVENNSASGPGGGIFELGVSAGPGLAPGGPLTLNHSEVADNSAASGGGIYASDGSPVTAVHTQIRENTPDNCFPPGVIAGCAG